MVLPTDWDRVYAVFFVLCEMGNIDPEAERWHNRYDEEESNSDCLKRLWDAALETEPDPPPVPRPAPPQESMQDYSSQPDPWATTPSAYSDEPPF
jgi:hypothetical protein